MTEQNKPGASYYKCIKGSSWFTEGVVYEVHSHKDDDTLLVSDMTPHCVWMSETPAVFVAYDPTSTRTGATEQNKAVETELKAGGEDNLLSAAMIQALGKPIELRNAEDGKMLEFLSPGIPFSGNLGPNKGTYLFHSIRPAEEGENTAAGIVILAYDMAQVRNALRAALSRPTQTPDAVEQLAVGVTPCIAGCRFPLEDHSDGCEGSLEVKYTQATFTHDSGLAGELLGEMVNRFLMWKLPENFSPDAGITFEPQYNAEYMATLGKPPMRHEPVGTNLFDFDQAKAMVLHILGDALTALQSNSDSELLRALSREVIATCKTEYGMLPDDLLARLEQGAA